MAHEAIKELFRETGFKPGFTSIPNEVLDFILPHLPEAPLRVFIYICRRTFGFGKRQDAISLQQICAGLADRSGVALDDGTQLSKPAVIRALRFLEEFGLLIRLNPRKVGRGAVGCYAVVLQGKAKQIVDRMQNQRVKQDNPSALDRNGKSRPYTSVNSEDLSSREKVALENPQYKGNSGKKVCSTDEALAASMKTAQQNKNENLVRGGLGGPSTNGNSEEITYDCGVQFNQIESTYWNPDPESEDPEYDC